ncbi:MAG: 23S rRNA (adenine(2030)-N(6))-methyltransferase RlmJ [Hyphomonadaceae bacterium]|nr:23S rRNA (adenine(2030)-N(6))-methyltransferase RlmJ [Hyphomonadaceae bacterium]
MGNHADVLKHAVLLFCLEALRRKPAPFAVLDTHAGRGLYDLGGAEAERSPEWRDGIGRIWDWPAPPPLVARYLAAVRGFNQDGALRVYPGSPALATTQLREQDVLMACELHPEEHAALRRALPRQPNVQVHARDGWEALGALSPPPQRRGLVAIDPPYEAPDELAKAARALGPALKRFGHGAYLWWRPLKSESALAAADDEARAQGAKDTLRADLWVDRPQAEGRLVGSSVLLINPPYGLEEELRDALPFLAEALTKGRPGWRLEQR